MDWADGARGIGIALVLVGHSQALPAPAVRWIFAFHMPLFFFLAGLTASWSRSRSFSEMVLSRARGLLLPFLFFWAVSYCFWLVERSFKPEDGAIPPWQPLHDLPLAAGPAVSINRPLWFLSCLFVTAVLCGALQRMRGWACWLSALLLSSVAVATLRDFGPFVPWSLDIACIVAPFYLAGASAAAWRDELPRRVLALLLVVGTALSLSAAAFNDQVDLAQRSLGARPVWFVAGSLGGIAAILALVQLLPTGALLRRLSHESLTLFATHMLVYTATSGIGILLCGLPRSFKADLPAPFALLDAGFAALVGLAAAVLLRRLAPIVLGASRASSTRPV